MLAFYHLSLYLIATSYIVLASISDCSLLVLKNDLASNFKLRLFEREQPVDLPNKESWGKRDWRNRFTVLGKTINKTIWWNICICCITFDSKQRILWIFYASTHIAFQDLTFPTCLINKSQDDTLISVKILNLYIILLCTHLYHFFPLSIHYLQCINCLLHYIN